MLVLREVKEFEKDWRFRLLYNGLTSFCRSQYFNSQVCVLDTVAAVGRNKGDSK